MSSIVIPAPMEVIVNLLHFCTPGSLVNTGAVILNLLPDREAEAEIMPQDISPIRVDVGCCTRFSAYYFAKHVSLGKRNVGSSHYHLDMSIEGGLSMEAGELVTFILGNAATVLSQALRAVVFLAPDSCCAGAGTLGLSKGQDDRKAPTTCSSPLAPILTKVMHFAGGHSLLALLRLRDDMFKIVVDRFGLRHSVCTVMHCNIDINILTDACRRSVQTQVFNATLYTGLAALYVSLECKDYQIDFAR